MGGEWNGRTIWLKNGRKMEIIGRNLDGRKYSKNGYIHEHNNERMDGKGGKNEWMNERRRKRIFPEESIEWEKWMNEWMKWTTEWWEERTRELRKERQQRNQRGAPVSCIRTRGWWWSSACSAQVLTHGVPTHAHDHIGAECWQTTTVQFRLAAL